MIPARWPFVRTRYFPLALSLCMPTREMRGAQRVLRRNRRATYVFARAADSSLLGLSPSPKPPPSFHSHESPPLLSPSPGPVCPAGQYRTAESRIAGRVYTAILRSRACGSFCQRPLSVKASFVRWSRQSAANSTVFSESLFTRTFAVINAALSWWLSQ